MPHLHICSLSKLVETIEKTRARHVVSLIDAGREIPYPLSVPIEQRLHLDFNDIVNAVPGFVSPQKTHVEKLIAFIRQWNQETPLVIHCWMGISRSTAGGYISQCALMEDADERELAQALREASPSATPNIKLVQFADEILGREGRMIRAIEEIGMGEQAYEGVPFSLPIR